MAKHTRMHFCISVRGMLNWDRRTTKKNLKAGGITKNDGTQFKSIEEFRSSLMDELAQGHEVLPMSKECVGFDYKTGCPGHEYESEEAANAH